MSAVRFGITALNGRNVVGEIKKNERGYFPMVVGALDCYASSGMYYEYERAKAVFEKSSQLMRRVERGSLRGEYGHPKMEPGMTASQFANRVMTIYEERTCCHHMSLELDFKNFKDEQGKPIIAIISEVCPSGPMGPILERSLNNPGENVCFSIRSFTDDNLEGGRIVRVIKTVVTFDYVNEPGIAIAQKWQSPALESLQDTLFTKGDIERGLTPVGGNVAQESALLTADELFHSMGWNRAALQSPAWSSWLKA